MLRVLGWHWPRQPLLRGVRRIHDHDNIEQAHKYCCHTTCDKELCVAMGAEGGECDIDLGEPDIAASEPDRHKLEDHNDFVLHEASFRLHVECELVGPGEEADACSKEQRHGDEMEGPHCRVMQHHRNHHAHGQRVVQAAEDNETSKRARRAPGNVAVQERATEVLEAIKHVEGDVGQGSNHKKQLPSGPTSLPPHQNNW
mmetsp:Transcript_126262/g.252235  ORF Transcript_126262/g.252235 Transcript_126262/m.252235 type:complete len:200 (-) Transcript_126262:394-993(-)